MILFDLACIRGHVFEGWFGSTDDYEAQRQRGLLSCPLCGTGDVDKAPMAPRLNAKSNQVTSRAPVAATIDTDRAKAMMAVLAAAQRAMIAQSDYVGKRFADEARAIAIGDSDERPIHGETTRDEALQLLDEGIEIAPLIFPLLPPHAEN